jgi:nucleotide-binding universal stress UspA family protein
MVIGVDFDEAGEVALEAAVALAHRMGGAEMHVGHVLRESAATAKSLDALAVALERAMSQLRDLIDRIILSPGVPIAVRVHVRVGEPAVALHQIAVDYDADMLVVGTHGRRGMQRLVLGSVAQDLARISRLPLYVARRKDFTGLERTPVIEAARPGEELHRTRLVSDVINFGARTSHISGLL